MYLNGNHVDNEVRNSSSGEKFINEPVSPLAEVEPHLCGARGQHIEHFTIVLGLILDIRMISTRP